MTRFLARIPKAATRDAANTVLDIAFTPLAWVVVAAMNSRARVWIENHIIDRGAETSRRIGGDE